MKDFLAILMAAVVLGGIVASIVAILTHIDHWVLAGLAFVAVIAAGTHMVMLVLDWGNDY